MHIGTMIKAGEDLKKLKKKSEGKHRYPTVRTEETSKEQLRRMCKEIAKEISDENNTMKQLEAFMEGVYDIEWITFNDHSYKAARLMVAGGKPNIWVNLQTNTVDGYWGTDKCSWGFVDNIGLDEYLEDLHAC